MAEMHKKLIGIGDKPIWKKICILAESAARCGVDDRQVEVIRDGEDGTFDIKLSNGKILDGVPSYELVLFERGALVSLEIGNQKGQDVRCLAEIVHIESNEATVLLENQYGPPGPIKVGLECLWGVQRVNGLNGLESVEHDTIPEGFECLYGDDSDKVIIVKVNENEDPTLTTYDVLIKNSDQIIKVDTSLVM